MTFTRSKSGLSNYNLFYRTDAIVYIEGRLTSLDNVQDDKKIYDSIFYKSLFSVFSPYDNIKIKIVGCKSNVLDYHDRILEEGINNSFAIIDKDYDGIYFNRTKVSKLIITHGYSWENDFWSRKLCLDIVSDLSLDAESACEIVNRKIERSINRLCLINKLNVVAQYFDEIIFPINKKGGVNGFNYDVGLKYPLSLTEIKRLFSKLSHDVKVYSDIGNKLKINEFNFECLIQGHFFEFMILNILSYAYKVTSGVSHNMIDINIIKNLAFNKFKLKPDYYLEPSTLTHYEEQFEKLFR